MEVLTMYWNILCIQIIQSFLDAEIFAYAYAQPDPITLM